ncbi:hypothetical protein HanRHA438_Chr01g0000031 [Helianthus annuus]|nr:hypothetical protein HanIR_Chr01g0000031 [Helianthus annuus]KAJ0946077.1 hypothetical protein HanRHA438_Chr01g0000031 [Helianthus annuus]
MSLLNNMSAVENLPRSIRQPKTMTFKGAHSTRTPLKKDCNLCIKFVSKVFLYFSFLLFLNKKYLLIVYFVLTFFMLLRYLYIYLFVLKACILLIKNMYLSLGLWVG